jgi:hypothetical protein
MKNKIPPEIEEKILKLKENKSNNPINENKRSIELNKIRVLQKQQDITDEYTQEICYDRGHLNGFKEGRTQTLGKVKKGDFEKRELNIILTCVKNELSFREKDASSCEMALREDYVTEMNNLINKTKEFLSQLEDDEVKRK